MFTDNEMVKAVLAAFGAGFLIGLSLVAILWDMSS